MTRRLRCMAAALLALVGFCALPALGQPWRDPEQHFFQTLLGDLPSELQLASREGKKAVLVIYEMDGCPFCVRLHRTALRDTSVQEYYRRHFSAFRVDVRGATMITGFDGQESTESAFAAKQKVRGTPTSVFYDLGGRELVRYTGAPRDRQEYILLGEFIVGRHYRSTSFPEYRRARTGQ